MYHYFMPIYVCVSVLYSQFSRKHSDNERNQQLMEPKARFLSQKPKKCFANKFSHFSFTFILTLTCMAPMLLWLLLLNLGLGKLKL